MSKNNVVIIKTNIIDIDPRLSKEIDALSRGGYIISLLCWDRQRKLLSKAQIKKGAYREIPLRVRAPYGQMILLFLPIWWCFVFWKLMSIKWDIVHSINLDTLVPSLLVAKLKRKPIIYEIFDVYADMRTLPNLFRHLGIAVEKLLLRSANGVILANEGQHTEMDGIPNKNVIEIYNSPPDNYVTSSGLNNETFIVFFAGVIFSARCPNIDKIYEAILEIDNTKIIIAGYGDMVGEIQRWASANPQKLSFLGVIDYSEVLKRTVESNLLFALYDPMVPTTRYAGCNKLFEAMMAGKPILVSKGTVMEKIVNRESCGLAVDPRNVNELRDTIITLKENSELCRRLGTNGRKAYENKFNWKIMEERLLDFYLRIK